MYFQFLIEDKSTEILVNHVMEKLKKEYPEKEISYSCKSFKGIGGFVKGGSLLQQKTGKLLNDLPMYMRAFDKQLKYMGQAALFVVVDNDKRDTEEFREQLENLAIENGILTDYVFCIAVKEMEAWLLGDIEAIELAYPLVRKNMMSTYTQDGICDTWEVLANMVYPGGLAQLRKKDAKSYREIGKMKSEWAGRIGEKLNISANNSLSFQYFIGQLKKRIEVV